MVRAEMAGGNLALAMLLRERDEGLPMPGGLVLLSPEVDLTESGDSCHTNRDVDVMLPVPADADQPPLCTRRGPRSSLSVPLFGQFDYLPPTFLQTGTRDLFLSNAARLHRWFKPRVPVECHLGEGVPHGGFMGGTPEDDDLA